MIIGDDSGAICNLTAWRNVAEDWSGLCSQKPRAKKGDIVYLESWCIPGSGPLSSLCMSLLIPLHADVLASWNSAPTVAPGAVPITCSASPQLHSRLQVCFRAMPTTIEDEQFRPDLRIGPSDSAVRRVASVLNWFEGMAGLS